MFRLGKRLDNVHTKRANQGFCCPLAKIESFQESQESGFFYILATKHLGIGMLVGLLVSTQISKKFEDIGWETVQTIYRDQYGR